MKYKVFYISSHGFGHLTRCLAEVERQIREENENSFNKKYRFLLICGENHIEFSKKYLSKYKNKIFYRELMTDVGLINKENTLKVDKEKLEEILKKFIDSWDSIVKKEIEKLKGLDIEEIYVDISPIGVLVGKKLEKKVIVKSNFTWYQQYKYLNLDKDIVDKFYEIDQMYDELYIYPLNLDMSHIKCSKKDIGYLARESDPVKVKELREKYEKTIFISCGRSASLEKISIKNFRGTVFFTPGIEVENLSGDVYKLPIDILDTQNYISSSEFIISKAGWGTIAESILGKTKMVLMERDGVLEDTHNIAELKKQGKAISIKEDELKEIDYLELDKKIKLLNTD
ncbi:glycosyltransferase [uncultured Ilyobacter sp.]|uniref:glycosyltransferase n=1 Tax=uncultured Ilyobacter sp. TaxID=544433 RepID=UPI0029F4BCBE|nr:glycosyltransferase [uncultured Ilyobacter sp.]